MYSVIFLLNCAITYKMLENVGFSPGVKVDTEINKNLNKEFLIFSCEI